MMLTSEFATEDVRQVMINISKLLAISDSEEEEFTPRPLTERLTVPSKPLVDPISSTPRPSLEFVSRYSPSPKKITSKQFQDGFLSRMELYKNRRSEEIQKVREKLEEKIKAGKQTKPEINPDSKKLVGTPTPIYDRYPEYIIDKKKRLEELSKKHESKKEEELKNYTFRPRTNETAKRFSNPEQFIESMHDWKTTRDKNKKLLTDKREAEIKSTCTFRPTIDKRSKKLITKRKSIGDSFKKIIESQDIPVRETDGMEPASDLSPKKTSRQNSISKYFSNSVHERLHNSRTLFCFELYGSREASPGIRSRRSLSRSRNSISSDTGIRAKRPSSASRASFKGQGFPPKHPSPPKRPTNLVPKSKGSTPKPSASEAILSDLGLSNNMITI